MEVCSVRGALVHAEKRTNVKVKGAFRDCANKQKEEEEEEEEHCLELLP